MHLLDLLDDPRPFALLRRRAPGHDENTVEVLLGPVGTRERLADLPDEGLALVPFRQIRERGFDVRDDGTPLTVLTPEESYTVPLDDALAQLPAHEVRVEGGGFDVGDEEYARIVGRVLDEEIGRGEGANFVIRRTYEGRIDGFSRSDALALFRRLLEGERGAYWTFVVHTGERTLVGASPEVHVRMSGGTVVMNPIRRAANTDLARSYKGIERANTDLVGENTVLEERIRGRLLYTFVFLFARYFLCCLTPLCRSL